MAIDRNPGAPLRHVASITSTGNWIAPAGVTSAFISIHGAGGGSGGAAPFGNRYGIDGRASGAGGAGPAASAWVQVNPGGTHSVTIGAAGTGGTVPATNSANAGTSAGTTNFDGAITVTGGAGGEAMIPNSHGSSRPAGANGTASGITALTTLSPSNLTITRVGTISSQNTGGGTGGAAVAAPRYGQGSVGSAGTAGVIHIYI
jgi:hypothetical protein